MNRSTLLALIISIAPTTQTPAVENPYVETGISTEVQDLILTAAARERLHSDYRRLLADEQLTASQEADFLTFLGQLDLRIARRCQELATSGLDVDLQQLPCPTTPSLGQAMSESAAEQTPGEAVALLDAQLNTGLGEFDEMLLRAQKQLSNRSAAAAAGEGTGGAKGGGSAAGEAGRTGTEGSQASEGGDARAKAGQTEGRRRTGKTQAGQEGEMPTDGRSGSAHRSASGYPDGSGNAEAADIPDGSDDDIVARQIREAAERETDPELKRKLWDEYRRYKQGRR